MYHQRNDISVEDKDTLQHSAPQTIRADPLEIFAPVQLPIAMNVTGRGLATTEINQNNQWKKTYCPKHLPPIIGVRLSLSSPTNNCMTQISVRTDRSTPCFCNNIGGCAISSTKSLTAISCNKTTSQNTCLIAEPLRCALLRQLQCPSRYNFVSFLIFCTAASAVICSNLCGFWCLGIPETIQCGFQNISIHLLQLLLPTLYKKISATGSSASTATSDRIKPIPDDSETEICPETESCSCRNSRVLPPLRYIGTC